MEILVLLNILHKHEMDPLPQCFPLPSEPLKCIHEDNKNKTGNNFFISKRVTFGVWDGVPLQTGMYADIQIQNQNVSKV